MSVVKMRCNRVSTFDQGGNNLKEISMISSDREGQPLNPPDQVTYANFSATFAGDNGAEIVHDAILDVTIAVGTPPAADAAKVEEEE